jgi:hypothetical protein
MYSPEGYESLASAYHRIDAIASKWSLTQPHIEGPSLPNWNTDESEAEVTRREAYHVWLWRRFAQRTATQLVATSPQGVPINLDIFSGNFWAAASPDFPEDPKEQAKLAERMGDIYYHIRPDMFTVDVLLTPLDLEGDRQFGETLPQRDDGGPAKIRLTQIVIEF